MSYFKKKALLKWLSLAATGLMVIALLMLSWLYTTESGLQWLAARIAQLQPQELRLGKISGTLNTRIKLAELDWQQEGSKVQMTGLSLDCQWLHLIDRLLSCDSIALTSLAVASVNDEKTTSSPEALPKLAIVTLPIAVKVKQVTMASISYQAMSAKITPAKNSDPARISSERAPSASTSSANTEYNVSGLVLKKLAFARSKVSVGALKLTFDEHKIAVSGVLDMRKKWPHQLAIEVLGAKLSGSVKSKGNITDSSQLTLQLQSPNQMLVTSDWFYNQGLFLKRGTLIADKQQVELASQAITLEQIKANFELNWPKLSANLQTQTSWQDFKDIQLTINTELANVVDWRASSAVSLLLKNDLNAAQIATSLRQTLPEAIDQSTPAIKQSWPVLASLDLAIKQGVATVKSNKLTLGNLTAAIQGEFNLDNPSTENFSLKGQLNGHSLVLNNAFDLADVNVSWQVEQQQSQWLISSQGKIGKLALANFDGKNIHWALDFSEDWQGDVKADALNINEFTLEQPSLKISGLPADHKMLISATLAQNTGVKLSFDGQLLQQDAKPFSISSDLSKAIWQISKLDFKAENQQQTLVLTTEQLQLSAENQRIKSLCLSGSGTLCINADKQAEQWSANLTFEQWSMSPIFQQIKHWQSRLLAQSSQYPQEVQGRVTGQLALSGKGQQLAGISANLTIPSFKWQSSDVQIHGQELTILSKQQNAIAITTQWQTINTQLQLPEWPAEISMPTGQMLLSISPDFTVDFDLAQTDITLSAPDESSPADTQLSKHLLTVALLKLQGKWQKDKISTRLNIQLSGEDEITAQFNSDWPLVDSARLDGDLSVNLQQFEWLKQWQKRIDKVEGSLVQNFTLAGTWREPIFTGEGSLGIEHLVIDEYGLDIRNSKVKLSSQQDRITLLGELQNPQGALTIAGQAKLSMPIKANLTIEGQQVTLVNNNDNKLIVSPMLKANYQDKHLTVDGNLIVDQADIKIASLPKPAISVSEDQVIVDEKILAVKDSAFDYNISLTLSAGDDVKISGFGLSSEIQGNLSSSLITGQPLTLNGRLDLKEGKFEAYKQTLTIEQGQLLFLGTAANPSIQFRAVRIVDDIKVGIIADGTIHTPRLTLFSEPTMADENVLSLLITGRNLDSLSQQEGNALTSAAISLGVESANKLVQKIGEQLGLKDVAFTSKSGNNGNSTRVDIAAKINDRLNVGYGTSIDSDSSVQAGWNIEYKLSPNISFEAISGDEISANINYKKQFSSTKDKDKDKDEN
ncbi:translocation/assembly module TamB domain-containing protein [Colwellia sp. MB02u-10]|uniref:translocation/assembly module TamB domain-containing protein n=1 Tax=Colwellia sp. MB02u-10 TaxID=2759828 RepID=UPI0015F49514|nr:translocation/assembly module TamB domain-containing protein [Colwellia sp. MB02u-10]MBA6341647.1 translocation/assembly module TamB domain-containing protein [Colwellia sp. MB02u-10]